MSLLGAARDPTLRQRLVREVAASPLRVYPLPGWFRLVQERAHKLSSRDPDLVRVRVANSQMLLRLSDRGQRCMYYRAYEPAEVRFLQNELRPGDCFVDAGANIGFFTLLASHAVGSSGHVFAFEPVSANFAHLAAHVELNHLQNVVLECMALGRKAGTVELGKPDVRGSRGQFTRGGTVDSESASVVTLDAYMEQAGIGSIDVLKIDVEGDERAVLDGMSNLLRSGGRPRAILLEVNKWALRDLGETPQALLDTLRSAGYDFGRLTGRGRVRLLTPRQSEALARPASVDEIGDDTVGFGHDWRAGIRGRRNVINVVATSATQR